MSATLTSCCADHGVELNSAHVEAVERIGDGTILRQLLALVEAYGPVVAAEIPPILAALVAGNYLLAFQLILAALAKAQTPNS